MVTLQEMKGSVSWIHNPDVVAVRPTQVWIVYCKHLTVGTRECTDCIFILIGMTTAMLVMSQKQF